MKAALASLTDDECEALIHDWRFLARDEQIAPDGDWLTWLILAGRGFGKTRTGAEWAREQVKAGVMRLHLIAPTAADARDTMVEGESGLLSVCWSGDKTDAGEPLGRPSYEPSKRRLTWANGAIATLFSAEEPERLRGPQCGAMWCDELCLVAGTMIATPDGAKRIETIRCGDLVMTRQGPRKVVNSGFTGVHPTYRLAAGNGLHITGTRHHPVFIEGKGFLPLGNIAVGDMVTTWRPSSNTTAGGGIGTAPAISATAKATCFTATNMSAKSGRSRTGSTFTTSTAIRGTMSLATLSHVLGRTICASIHRAGPPLSRLMSAAQRLLLSGPSASLAGVGASTAAMSSSPWGSEPRRAASWNAFALGSARPTSASGTGNGRSHRQRSARNPSRISARSVPVSFAGRSSERPTREQNVALGNVGTSIVLSVEPTGRVESVYNIEVEGEHEYFANGILTHNCAWAHGRETWDMAMFGLRLGDRPRTCITTTPKPLKLLREIMADKRTVVTRGSTFANAANLAPTFLQAIRDKYEGTRLGRQELEAELLEEAEGALWTRSQVEACHVKQPPEMLRVVVAIDPAVTETEESAETGIVVAGLGMDRRGYVLADVSGRRSPAAWTAKAIEMFDRFKADRIVAEGNQGGNLVTHAIHTARSNAPVKIVNARVGKRARAEPVAALYEQGKVSHCAAMPDLEDQMVNWEPLSGLPSPDRLDALVWALTELMVMPAAPVAATGTQRRN